MLTVQSEQPGPTSNALILRRTITGLAGSMTRSAAIILRLVCVWGTRGITFVLMHHQVMLTAGALVRSVLTAGAVGFAWHARAILGIYVKKCRKNRALRHSISENL